MNLSEIVFKLNQYTSKEKLSLRKIGLELKRKGFFQTHERINRFELEPRLVYTLYTKKEYFNEFSEYAANENNIF